MLKLKVKLKGCHVKIVKISIIFLELMDCLQIVTIVFHRPRRFSASGLSVSVQIIVDGVEQDIRTAPRC